MKLRLTHTALGVLILLLAGCGGGGDSANPTPAGGGPTITGLDANTEYNRLAGQAQQSLHLPRGGETKSWVDYSFFARVNGASCYYVENGAFSVANVTADSFEESGSFSYSKTWHSSPSCPSTPPNARVNYTKTRMNADYTAEKLNSLKSFFDLRKRAQSETWIQQIGITSSEAATFSVPNSQPVKTQRITIDIVETNGVKRREVHDFSLDSWFLGQVMWTKSVNGNPAETMFEVVSYQAP